MTNDLTEIAVDSDSMSLHEKYLEALKLAGGWVKVSEWAIKVGEVFPDVLEKADKQAANQVNDTTGLREIAARISSRISTGAYANQIEIDTSEKPRLVRYLNPEEQASHEKEEIEDDVAPLKRSDIIKNAEAKFSTEEQYRVSEFEAIAGQLRQCFGLQFEVDHAQALLNQEEPGPHHPDNMQLLLKAHNGKKNNQNWKRFSFAEQMEYIESALKMQAVISERLGVELVTSIQNSLRTRLENVFE